MGMLDEAIREHFDLKRRNGADPAVIAIEEREALGDPAQREARAAQIAADRSAELAGEEVEEVVVVAEEPGAVAIVEHEVLEAPGVVAEEETVVAAPEPEAVVEAEVAEEVELPAEAPEQETQAFTVEESQEAVMPEPPARPVGAPPPAADTPGASEGDQPEEARDELEETPEFLEETPEHDRLWFERKPPRDFDF